MDGTRAAAQRPARPGAKRSHFGSCGEHLRASPGGARRRRAEEQVLRFGGLKATATSPTPRAWRADGVARARRHDSRGASGTRRTLGAMRLSDVGAASRADRSLVCGTDRGTATPRGAWCRSSGAAPRSSRYQQLTMLREPDGFECAVQGHSKAPPNCRTRSVGGPSLDAPPLADGEPLAHYRRTLGQRERQHAVFEFGVGTFFGDFGR